MPLTQQKIEAALHEHCIPQNGFDITIFSAAIRTVFTDSDCDDESVLRSVVREMAANPLSLHLLQPVPETLRLSIQLKLRSALSALSADRKLRKKTADDRPPQSGDCKKYPLRKRPGHNVLKVY